MDAKDRQLRESGLWARLTDKLCLKHGQLVAAELDGTRPEVKLDPVKCQAYTNSKWVANASTILYHAGKVVEVSLKDEWEGVESKKEEKQ